MAAGVRLIAEVIGNTQLWNGEYVELRCGRVHTRSKAEDLRPVEGSEGPTAWWLQHAAPLYRNPPNEFPDVSDEWTGQPLTLGC